MSEPARRRAAAFTVAMLASFAPAGLAATPAHAAGNQCAAAGQAAPSTAWAQQMLAPATVWALTKGAGVRIALLDSGVDATVPQLRGRVDPGYDAIKNGGKADTDCFGTGTHVAGSIAAAKIASGVYGVAPAATIVPVRVIGEPGNDMSATPTASALARGIRWAAGHHVDVIDVSVWLTKDDPGVRQAVADAIGAGVTVIAAAGDLGGQDGNPATFPASYPDVIGVTAIGAAGLPWEDSERGGYIDLAAPGAGVDVLARGDGVVTVEGSTAVAAGFVSGAAALVRDRWPRLGAAQLAQRLFGTASPATAGAYYGHGIVNPAQAVTAGMVDKAPVPAPALRPATLSQAQLAAAASARHSRALAVEWTVFALVALLVVTLLAVGVPRARRRAWRPAYAPEPDEKPEPIEPQPMALLFEDP